MLNSAEYLSDSINSVIAQSHKDVEYIIIDGGSTDGTLDIIRKYENYLAKWTSEPDTGMYAALNEGIQTATGEVIVFLHAGDFYPNENILENVAAVFEDHKIDAVYGDLQYVKKNNPKRVSRNWHASEFVQNNIKRGWMPPHPTLFVRKVTFDQIGLFNCEYKIAADYDFILRLFSRPRVVTKYLPEVLIKMRVGGKSNNTLTDILLKSWEDYKILKANKITFPFFVLLSKNFRKFPQFFIDQK